MTVSSKEPLVSVIIPTFNQADVVGEAVESALTQQELPLEIIVVDDGSTDETGAILRASFGSRIRYVYQPNAGLGGARNSGHREARGQYVAWLDSDDLAEPSRWRLQRAVLDRFPDIGLVGSAFAAFDESGSTWEDFGGLYYGLDSNGLRRIYTEAESFSLDETGEGGTFTLYHGDVYPRIAYGNFVHPPTVMMRSDVWRRAGPLDSQYLGATDWEFLVRASRTTKFAHLGTSLLRYRRSRNQMTDEGNVRKNVPREMRAFEKMLVEDPALRFNTRQVRELYWDWHISLAAASLEDDRLRALRHLALSVRYGIRAASFRTAAHAVFPPVLIRPLRTSWRFWQRLIAKA